MASEVPEGAEASSSTPRIATGPTIRFFGPNLDLDLAQHFQTSLVMTPPFNRPPPPLMPRSSTNIETFGAPENPYLKFYSQVFGSYLASGPSSPSDGSCWGSNASGSPTALSDPFLRGEVPLEMNMFGQTGPVKESRTPERKFTISDAEGPLPYLPRNIRHKVLFNYCVFCKNNGEDERFYLSHTLKDMNGCVTCPILYDYTCPICGATGRISHTIRYCPRNRDKKVDDMVPISTLKQMRSSAGGMSYNARREALAVQGSLPRQNRLRKANAKGPNSAWTGLTNQPAITPMPGDTINNRMREEMKLTRSPLPDRE